MDPSATETQNHLSELPRALEDGEDGAITRNATSQRRAVNFGTMLGKIHLKPGWDDPIDLDRFLAGDV